MGRKPLFNIAQHAPSYTNNNWDPDNDNDDNDNNDDDDDEYVLV